jgi:hypothetical protein
MKRYQLSAAESFRHVPEHPERTGRRQAGGGLNFDMVYQVWTNRAALAKTIRLQERRERHSTDWSACVKLTDGEGY